MSGADEFMYCMLYIFIVDIDDDEEEEEEENWSVSIISTIVTLTEKKEINRSLSPYQNTHDFFSL